VQVAQIRVGGVRCEHGAHTQGRARLGTGLHTPKCKIQRETHQTNRIDSLQTLWERPNPRPRHNPCFCIESGTYTGRPGCDSHSGGIDFCRTTLQCLTANEAPAKPETTWSHHRQQLCLLRQNPPPPASSAPPTRTTQPPAVQTSRIVNLAPFRFPRHPPAAHPRAPAALP